MIVRTYGRRNRGLTRTYSDSFNTDDDVSDDPFGDSFSLSQDTPQDLYSFPFPSSQDQESSSFWSSQENNSVPTLAPPPRPNFSNSESGVVCKSKKQKKEGYFGQLIPPTSTLMEAQEFGEMMEHVDEVNFAIDGLKKGSQVRIRRASLLSLLSICGTAQQRRLLRTEGLAKTIVDAVLGLSFDDSPSNLAAAALFYVLTSDGQDDHLLESQNCICFLIKLLKPVISTASKDKSQRIGSKLLALRKDADIIRDATKISDSSTSAIFSKVQEILVSCKEMKSSCGGDDGITRPELSPKWIALLTMEKACLSKISLEDTTGTMRKTGGNFKEKLRELGGLDAVFEVIMNCYSVMEGWLHLNTPIQDSKHDSNRHSLVLLLKCLKIMENSTFLSKDNQSHLLGMRGHLDSHKSQLSFVSIVIGAIKILSDLHLRRSSSSSADEKSHNIFEGNGTSNASELALDAECKADKHDVIFISSESNSEKSLDMSENNPWSFTDRLGHSESNSETTTTSVNDNCCLNLRSRSSFSSSCSQTLRSSKGGALLSTNGLRSNFCLLERTNSRKDEKYASSFSSSYSESLRSSMSGTPLTANGSRSNFCHLERSNSRKDEKCGLLEDSEDPYAFDEDAFEPSKWDLLSGKQKKSRTKRSGVKYRDVEDGCQYEMIMSQQESNNGENCQRQLNNRENHQVSSSGEYHFSHESSCAHADDSENSTLFADCLLTAVKCRERSCFAIAGLLYAQCAIFIVQQIAAYGGLETMSLLIASHFRSFSSSVSPSRDGFESDHKDDRPLTDQELDFLVAILGLLVNLVEKDEDNRSRLAAARISLPNSEGFEEESHRDVIQLLCSIFLANQGAGDPAGEGTAEPLNDEAALLEGEKEAEMMIVEAYAALLLAFLSTESMSTRAVIAECLPNHNLGILVPVLERFVAFHLTLNMISPETHKAVSEVIESCRVP
ncbi:Wings apart-like protein 1 [Citrus sinensis]|uniref:Wings apart-like protein 1 n=1 Tax=Citrus sinensis TaxID=2711 RepID=A0ACB8NH34_CITSI|nr:Wings apart-like protein 1 [Citrus sinensis]